MSSSTSPELSPKARQNRYANRIQTMIHVPDPRNKVTVDSSSLVYGG